MKSHPRVLFTTVFRHHSADYCDWFGPNVATPFHFALIRYTSFGLRFIKQNVPGIEIMEYPSWSEYRARLREGWDVVGFSFYQNEIPGILTMVEEARGQGVKELWAGNYGALTDGMEATFDRIFVGYAEHEVAQLMGTTIDRIVHPPLFLCVYLNPFNKFLNFRFKILGILFTQRGCPFRCNFCQTPTFCPKPARIPIESIEAVLEYYDRIGIKEILIPDESFGTFQMHSEKVVGLLQRHGFYWSVQIRADELLRHLDEWRDQRLVTPLIGIESLSNRGLELIGKREQVDLLRRTIKRLHESGRWSIGGFMIGHPTDTEEAIRDSLVELASTEVDFTQLCVVTPYPRTPLWEEIESEYGIFETDWCKWDARHLVWNHPYVSSRKMEELFRWGMRRLNPASKYLRSVRKWLQLYYQGEGGGVGFFRLLSHLPSQAICFDVKDRGQKSLLGSAAGLAGRGKKQTEEAIT